MTPERVAEIAQPVLEFLDLTIFEEEQVERAITLAVNEAICEAESVADHQVRLAKKINDPAGYAVATEIKESIRDLKLKEE